MGYRKSLAPFGPSFIAGLKIWEVGVGPKRKLPLIIDPEKSGLFLHPRNRDTKVIVISMDAEGVGGQGSNPGCDFFVTRPAGIPFLSDRQGQDPRERNAARPRNPVR